MLFFFFPSRKILPTHDLTTNEFFFSWILIRPPHVVVRSHFLLPHAATVRHRSLLGALRILELVPVQLGVKDAGQDAGRREVVAVILPESLLLVNGALRRARVRGQGSGRHVVLVPLTRRARHQAAQRVERVGLARRRRVWDHWFRLEKKEERSTVAFFLNPLEKKGIRIWGRKRRKIWEEELEKEGEINNEIFERIEKNA